MHATQQLALFAAKPLAESSLAVAVKIKKFHKDNYDRLFAHHQERLGGPSVSTSRVERAVAESGFQRNGHLHDERFVRALNIHVWAKSTSDSYVPLSPEDMYLLNNEMLETEIYGQ